MAGPYTITNITDVPLSSTSSLLTAERGRTLAEASRVKIYANRETSNIVFNITVGADQVNSDAPAKINATVGDSPLIPDDLIADTFGDAGAEIVILARNADAAAAREARVIVFVIPVDDDALQQVMNRIG